MKKIIYLALYSITFFSCRKQGQQENSISSDADMYQANVRAYLKKNLADSDYASADLNNSVISKQGAYWYLRIAFANGNIARDFILVQTDSLGNCSSGKFVHIRRDSTDMSAFNGKIGITGFDHASVITSVKGGVQRTLDCSEDIESVDEPADDCSLLVPECAGCLPEVIVVGYRNSGGGPSAPITYSDYIDLALLAGAAGSSMGTPAGSGSSYAQYSPVASPALLTRPLAPSPVLIINYEELASKPGINVAAFMKCFSAIPDAGSACSVTIFTDLPVDDNPSYIFNILTGATGHCFLQLTKTNGAQSVTQIIGKTTSKAIAVLGFPVPGKIVDNSAHKYNASLTMGITAAQLQTEINAITAIGSAPQYDMWENNCVDYAVGILNKVRPSEPLDIVMLKDVTSGDSYSTPQGLYITLDQMKQANGPEAKNISVDLKQNAGTSHGACN